MLCCLPQDAADLSQQYTTLSVTPQSSTESAPDVYPPSQPPVITHQMAPLQPMQAAQPPGCVQQNQQVRCDVGHLSLVTSGVNASQTLHSV